MKNFLALFSQKPPLSQITFWTFVAIVVVVQSFGIGFGLPQQYHPDEYFINLNTFGLFHELLTGSFGPVRYALGIRWFYFAGYIMFFLVGLITGRFSNFADFYQTYYQYGNPWVDGASPFFYIIPRVISFCFYIGALIMLYIIAKKMAGPGYPAWLAKTILVCALFLPAGYLYSHYGTRESACSFFCMCIINHALFHFNPQSKKSIAIAALLLGLSTAIREQAAIFFIMYATVIIRPDAATFRTRLFRMTARSTMILLPAALLFFALNPNRLFIDNVSDVTSRYQTSIEKPVNISYAQTHINYPLAFSHEFSLLGIVLLVSGCAVAWKRYPKLRPMLIIIMATYIILDCMKGSGYKSDRFIMHLFLPVLLAGTVGLFAMLKTISKHRLIMVLPLIFATGNSHELVSDFLALNGHDTRDIARTWILKNIPKNSTIARETIFTPSIDSAGFNVVLVDWALGKYCMDSLRTKGVAYVLTSANYQDGKVLGNMVKENYDKLKPYCIQSFSTTFRPELNGFHSPDIFVYKIQ